LALIGELYKEKAQADHWVEAKVEEGGVDAPTGQFKKRPVVKPPTKVRFDAFVLKRFIASHGTKGIARRHLRNFVLSVQKLSGDHSRVDVFRKLSGIPALRLEDDEP